MGISQHTPQNILGVDISTINLDQTVGEIQAWISKEASTYICVTPAHGVMECYNNPGLRKVFNNSGMTTPDGMAIVWLLKLYGHKNVGRVYGPDLMLAVCKEGLEHGWRHYFYGGKPGVAEKLANELSRRFDGLAIAGSYCPPFRPLTSEEAQSVEDEIKRAKPDIVWVGISTPKQEIWMAEFVKRLDGPVLIGVGAAFDFLSGEKRQAPRWIQRSGLEWLFRWAMEPKRLWRRYIQYPKFVVLALGQFSGLLQFPSESKDV